MVHVKLVAVMASLALGSVAFSQEAAQIERGKAVFAEQKCRVCHSIGGEGNAKGSLDSVATKLSAEEIRQWILEPKVMAKKMKAERKPRMKAFTDLKAEEVEALMAYLGSLKEQ